ncbi:MAG: four helix bundle protein [Planctomycetota bacterium]
MPRLFDHEKLDVYQRSIEFIGWANRLIQDMTGTARFARDQLLRSSQSIAQNIAEGNGKRDGKERRRFFEIARGSAMESAATLDVLVAIGAVKPEAIDEGKALLVRVVEMLTGMAPPVGK